MERRAALLLTICIATAPCGWADSGSATSVRATALDSAFTGTFNPGLVTPEWQIAWHNLGNWAAKFPYENPYHRWSGLLPYVDPQKPNLLKLSAVSPLNHAIQALYPDSGENPLTSARLCELITKITTLGDDDQRVILRALEKAVAQEAFHDELVLAVGKMLDDHQMGKKISFVNEDLPALETRLGKDDLIAQHLRNLVELGVFKETNIGSFLEESQEKASGRVAALRERVAEMKTAGVTAGSAQELLSEPRIPKVSPSGLVYASAAMEKVERRTREYGPTLANVLIQGETGTGKELVAHGIHNYSNVAEKNKFVPINVVAIPSALLSSTLFGHKKGAFTGAERDQPGVIQEAGGGTLFLDEIGDLPLEVQANFLRFIDNKEIQPVGASEPVKLIHPPRLIAATNKDLAKEVREGRFRADLYHRLNTLRIHLPPLRERSEDILPLADFFIRRYHAPRLLSVAVQKLLTSYPWPGNVRELDNAIQRAIIHSKGQAMKPHHFDLEPSPHDPGDSPSLETGGQALLDFTGRTLQALVTHILDMPGSDHMSVPEIAQALGISRAKIYRDLNLMRKRYPQLAGQIPWIFRKFDPVHPE